MGKPNIRLGIAGSETTWATCTVMQADGQFCDLTVPDDAPISACKRHLVAAFLYCENLIAETRSEAEFGMKAIDVAEANAERLRDRTQPVVYYARVGQLIKIGTTVDLRTRMFQLRPDSVLATEPGSYELEAERHRQFACSKAATGREYFHETEDLTAHIRSLQMATADRFRGHTKNLFLSDAELEARGLG